MLTILIKYNYRAGFIKTQGPRDWLKKMEGMTTGDGTMEGDLEYGPLSDSCPIPDMGLCQSFTPPAFYWIRRAASNLHSILASAHDQLQSDVLIAALDLQQIVQDFSATTLATENASPSFVLSIISVGKSEVKAMINPNPTDIMF